MLEGLKKQIKKKRWTIKTTAEKIGITENTLYRWFSGKIHPRWDNIYKICEVFGCDIREIN